MEPSIFDVCRTGNLELLKTMDIPDINVRDIFGMTPLAIAILHGRLEIAKYILSFISFPSLDVNIKDDMGYTALHEACRAFKEGYPEIIKLLISHGADINAQNASGLTPLYILISFNDVHDFEEIAQYLISPPSLDIKSADVNVQDNDGWTLLLRAVSKNRLDVARFLLKYKADPLIKNIYGICAYDVADITDNEEIIKIMEEVISELYPPDIKGAL